MKYFKRIITHYLTMAYTRQGDNLEADCYVEIEDAFDNLEKYIDKRIAAAIAAHVEADNEMDRHLSQWHDCDYD